MRRPVITFIACVVAVGLAVTAIVAVARLKVTTTGRPTAAVNGIPGSDSMVLGSRIYLPTGAGKHPLLIMPASWGASTSEYALIAPKLAARGYVVVTYAQRGFTSSQGQIDLAGYPTQADVSSVITWALRNTPADPNRIGAIGVSYGAGISLLAAARDPRIKAVVAMSTWTDFERAFFPNSTPNTLAVSSLFPASVVARVSAPLARFHELFTNGKYAAASAQLSALAPSRAPSDVASQLNKNHPAIMIANDFEDSYFPPNDIVSFFNQLTVPKRLQLAPGDHGSQETPGLDGKASLVWDDAAAWLDHYVRGVNNGIQAQAPVQLQDVVTGLWHRYAAWPSGEQSSSLYLNESSADAGTLDHSAATAWSQTIVDGSPTIANSAPFEVGAFPYRVLTGVRLTLIPRASGAVWNGPVIATATSIDGGPVLHMTVTPSSPSATFFAYLYDTNAIGTSSLITSAPYSIVDSTAGIARSIDLELSPISWTLAPGHRLTLVIDTVDSRYSSFGNAGQTIAFSSPSTDPSRLVVPTG